MKDKHQLRGESQKTPGCKISTILLKLQAFSCASSRGCQHIMEICGVATPHQQVWFTHPKNNRQIKMDGYLTQSCCAVTTHFPFFFFFYLSWQTVPTRKSRLDGLCLCQEIKGECRLWTLKCWGNWELGVYNELHNEAALGLCVYVQSNECCFNSLPPGTLRCEDVWILLEGSTFLRFL